MLQYKNHSRLGPRRFNLYSPDQSQPSLPQPPIDVESVSEVHPFLVMACGSSLQPLAAFNLHSASPEGVSSRPTPRRLDRTCGRARQESVPRRGPERILGRRACVRRVGYFERGTLNADREANRKGNHPVQRPCSFETPVGYRNVLPTMTRTR
jgi:hypothetical protein